MSNPNQHPDYWGQHPVFPGYSSQGPNSGVPPHGPNSGTGSQYPNPGFFSQYPNTGSYSPAPPTGSYFPAPPPGSYSAPPPTGSYSAPIHPGYYHSAPPPGSHSSGASPVDLELGDEPDSPVAGSGANKRMRGSGFSIEEDRTLCNAWLDTSLDPVRGNDQSGGQFWSKIHATYHAQKGSLDSSRDVGSLKHRWGKIQHAVCKFVAKLDTLQSTMSGANEQDKIQRAKELFKSDVGSKFQYEHCYNILKVHVKWMQDKAKGKGPTNSSSNVRDPINIGDDDPEAPIPRPPGRDASKKKNKAQGTVDHVVENYKEMKETREKSEEMYMAMMRSWKESNEKMYEQSQVQIEIEQAQLQLQVEQKERDVIYMNTDGMTPEQKRFHAMDMKRIMDKHNLM